MNAVLQVVQKVGFLGLFAVAVGAAWVVLDFGRHLMVWNPETLDEVVGECQRAERGSASDPAGEKCDGLLRRSIRKWESFDAVSTVSGYQHVIACATVRRISTEDLRRRLLAWWDRQGTSALAGLPVDIAITTFLREQLGCAERPSVHETVEVLDASDS